MKKYIALFMLLVSSVSFADEKEFAKIEGESIVVQPAPASEKAEQAIGTMMDPLVDNTPTAEDKAVSSADIKDKIDVLEKQQKKLVSDYKTLMEKKNELEQRSVAISGALAVLKDLQIPVTDKPADKKK